MSQPQLIAQKEAIRDELTNIRNQANQLQMNILALESQLANTKTGLAEARGIEKYLNAQLNNVEQQLENAESTGALKQNEL